MLILIYKRHKVIKSKNTSKTNTEKSLHTIYIAHNYFFMFFTLTDQLTDIVSIVKNLILYDLCGLKDCFLV